MTTPAYGPLPNAFTTAKPSLPIGGSPPRGGSSGKRSRGAEMACAHFRTLTKSAASAMSTSAVVIASRFFGTTCATSRWTVRGICTASGTPPGAPGTTPCPPSESELGGSDDAVGDAGHGCPGPDNAIGDRWPTSTRLRRDAPRGSGRGGAPAALAPGAAWSSSSPRSPAPGESGDDRERQPLGPTLTRPRERVAARATTGLRDAAGCSPPSASAALAAAAAEVRVVRPWPDMLGRLESGVKST